MVVSHSNVFVLTLKDQVIFPQMRTNVSVPQELFTDMCEFFERHDSRHIAVITAKPSSDGDLFSVGTYCKIASHSKKVAKLRGREIVTATLSLEGESRFQLSQIEQSHKLYHVATIALLPEQESGDKSVEVAALVQSVQQAVLEFLSINKSSLPKSAGDLNHVLAGGKQQIHWPASASLLADLIGSRLEPLTLLERQRVLEAINLRDRLQLVLEYVQNASDVQRISAEIKSKMRKRREDELREMVMRQQMQELRKEMRRLKSTVKHPGGGPNTEDANEAEGEPEQEDEEEIDDYTALKTLIDKAGLTPEAHKLVQREMRRLQNIQPQHPEYTVSRTYVETICSLPWTDSTDDAIDLRTARQILDEDHYGLEKVKRRILEFLAVQKMRGDIKGPILCLHGPPGVGKTSLGRSIAKALGRKFHRIALGGVRDEAELRGHRRTYIGSMPGAIVQALATLKVNNPVILLDEIDKVTKNAMFNPSGALLELLDPEQNFSFKDHYLNTPFDLSKTLFICTANDLQVIDRPLLDRMEVIDLTGYTVDEKINIARTHLVPKQLRVHALLSELEPSVDDQTVSGSSIHDVVGLKGTQEHLGRVALTSAVPRLELTDAAISDLITKWTMESGVRSLERRIAQVCRWAALRVAGGGGDDVFLTKGALPVGASGGAHDPLAECAIGHDGVLRVDAKHLALIVGIELFEPDVSERLSVGVAMGLAVTPTGGQLLFVEATRTKGSGRLTITGQLGEVMRESVTTAMSLLRSKLYTAAQASHETALGSSTGRKAAASSGAFDEVLREFLQKGDAVRDPFGSDDIHVHFPAGGIPKDGPSAGAAITLALASLWLGRPVRSDTAVTGEITLRGHVLPVGGIRDKVLAAHRAGVKHVLLPYANRRHANEDLVASALGDMELHFVRHIDEALAWAFPTITERPLPADVASREDAELRVGGLASFAGTPGSLRARL